MAFYSIFNIKLTEAFPAQEEPERKELLLMNMVTDDPTLCSKVRTGGFSCHFEGHQPTASANCMNGRGPQPKT